MTLLRRVLGDTLRGRRLRQRRTLREVSGAARVSLGYLSEVERGQKEASSELLASICEALDVKLSDVLSEVSENMRRSERAAEVARMPGRVMIPAPARRPVPAGVGGRFEDLPEFDEDAFEDAASSPAGPAGPASSATASAASDEDVPFDEDSFGAAGFPDALAEDSVASELTDALTDAPTDSLTGAPTDSLTDAPTDSLAGVPAGSVAGVLAGLPEPGELELDDVDLAELETGDGLGELEVLVGLTDLPGPTVRCLAAA
jgi:transcriptional regulator with XRE-family HTH domain